MQDLKIDNCKVLHVMTDIASNFGKAFRNFSRQHVSTDNLTDSDNENNLIVTNLENDDNNSHSEFDTVDLSSLLL